MQKGSLNCIKKHDLSKKKFLANQPSQKGEKALFMTVTCSALTHSRPVCKKKVNMYNKCTVGTK